MCPNSTLDDRSVWIADVSQQWMFDGNSKEIKIGNKTFTIDSTSLLLAGEFIAKRKTLLGYAARTRKRAHQQRKKNQRSPSARCSGSGVLNRY